VNKVAKVGFGITSSYCTIKEVLIQMKSLIELGHNVIPIVSPSIVELDTRFGKGENFKKEIEKVSGKTPVTSIIEAERFGPQEQLDVLLIAPATGNFIGKLANGITDSTVNLVAKATLRNQRPVVIAVSTNDGLGLNGQNIMKLLNTKNIYFVPFGQDDFEHKPNSLIAHYDLIPQTIDSALLGRQYQPILIDYPKVKVLNNK
jgi:dipicolinate synthase subunit B